MQTDLKRTIRRTKARYCEGHCVKNNGFIPQNYVWMLSAVIIFILIATVSYKKKQQNMEIPRMIHIM